ncbi:acyl-CoA N-acyltransferase [Xylogone sp. PMI_703]|nr:acyl-CoA N-acyltransferase [Xylogone sp. PMI_703]
MATNNLRFRIAIPDDAKQLQELVQSAFRTEDSRPDWTGNIELAANFRYEMEEVVTKIANPDLTTLVALDSDNNLVATIEVSKRGVDCGRLSMIAVDDRYQRGGVGRQVLAYAEDYCQRTWGAKKFSLNALSTRKALIEWYMRRGYQDTGDRTPFPRERFSNLALPDDMCFIELEKDFREAPDAKHST